MHRYRYLFYQIPGRFANRTSGLPYPVSGWIQDKKNPDYPAGYPVHPYFWGQTSRVTVLFLERSRKYSYEGSATSTTSWSADLCQAWKSPTGKNCWLTYFQIHVGEIVEIGGVIDGFDEDRDGGGSLPDVGPVDAVEPVQHLHILDRLDSQLHVVAESTHKKRDRMSK